MSRRSFVVASVAVAPLIYEAPKLTTLGESKAEGFGISGPVEATKTPAIVREVEETPTPRPRDSHTSEDPTESDNVVYVGGEVVLVLPQTGIGTDR